MGQRSLPAETAGNAASAETGRYLIGRQPILDRNEKGYAYELLFRAATAPNSADVSDGARATARVILNTMTGFGARQILGNSHGFINVEMDMLMGEHLELLPKEAVVLELLEIVEVTDQVLERCRELKEKGFRLALDDHVFGPAYEKLYDVVDFVKVDLLLTPVATLPAILDKYRHHPFHLLAEKVETRDDFRACLDLGFDYFQGYYFAKPSILEKKKIGTDGMVLLKLMRVLDEDGDGSLIEEAFRSSGTLTYKLLMLVNSVVFPKRQKIQTVRHAIAMLGRQQIRRWIQLALFVTDGSGGIETPLVDLAAVRARFMAEMARTSMLLQHDADAEEHAFTVGILSLIGSMYDISLEDVAGELALSAELTAGLTKKEGPFGALLYLAEALETSDFSSAFSLVNTLRIPMNLVLQAQKTAYGWQDAG